jgi:hypothetical protein
MEAPVLSLRQITKLWPKIAPLTNIPPRIAILVDLHLGGHNVRGIAEEREPHILDMKVIERLDTTN